MTDGMNDMSRGLDEVRLVELRAEKLADAIRDATDPVFGLSPRLLDIANGELRRAGLMLVKAPR